MAATLEPAFADADDEDDEDWSMPSGLYLKSAVNACIHTAKARCGSWTGPRKPTFDHLRAARGRCAGDGLAETDSQA